MTWPPNTPNDPNESWSAPSDSGESKPQTPVDPPVVDGADEPTRQQHAWSAPQAEPKEPSANRPNWMDGANPPPPAAHRGKGLMTWFAVAVISALVGGVVGAVVVNGDDTNVQSASKNTTATPVSPSQATAANATPSLIRGVLEKVQPAVVSIQVGRGQGSGTGMILTPDGEILTNAHVVSGASDIRVTLDGQKDSISAKLLGIDRTIDSAIIKIDRTNLPTVTLGNSNAVLVGDAVVAIGNALALPGGPSVTTGIISARDRTINSEDQVYNNLIQTDAAINPGNSGGPLANMAGEVIGMNTAVIRGSEGEYENIGFALAADSIKPAFADLRAGKAMEQAYIGVSAVTLDDSIRERYRFTPEKGVVVDSVVAGSPADDAGISRFDVITEFDGKVLETNEDLVVNVRGRRPGDKVKVVVFKEGRDRQELTVTLAARPSLNNR